MTILEINTDPISRIFKADLQEQYTPSQDRDQATAMMDYHDGNDVKHIKRKMAERFATEITQTTDSTTGEIQYNQVKTKQAQEAAIANNLFEIVTRGMTRKISNNVATLSENSIFEYNDEQFAIDIEESRERGDFGLMFSRLDEISVVVGSSVMLVQISNNDYQYQPITPDKVWIVYGDEIVVNDETIPVDPFNLEHAQSVTIQLDEKQYATYIGRSDVYPDGRFVKYEADEWHQIPPIGNKGADDYYVNDEFESIANPLTLQQDDTGNYTTPEYPIITWQGTTQGIGKELLPIQTGLYENAKEVDLSSSRVAMSANKAARGFWAYTNEGGVLANQNATDDEGIANLAAGQSVMVLTVPSSNIDVANNTIDRLIKSLADSWSVPQYSLAIDTAQVPSGTALMESNRPQVKMQSKRKDINDGQMARLFEIEKALAGIETGSEVGSDVEQTWLLKPTDIFKTDIEIIAETKELLALGLIDKANALVRIEGMTTEEAQEFIDSLQVAVPVNNTANRLNLV